MTRILLSLAFLATIPAANWMIGHIGTVCPAPQHGPCVVPVWPWPLEYAPSGSILMGVALVLRNVLQVSASRLWILGCIVIGALISAQVAPAALTIASASAFFLSEMTDWAVYSPMRRRGMTKAILLAGSAGAVVDSCVFITLAFEGELALIPGQIIAKLWASLFAACIITIGARIYRDSDSVTKDLTPTWARSRRTPISEISGGEPR